MLNLGTFNARDCQGLSRRSFLQFGAGLPFAGGVLSSSSAFGEVSPKAQSVMLVWLVGGPSHLDLFDPKPKAPLGISWPVFCHLNPDSWEFISPSFCRDSPQ